MSPTIPAALTRATLHDIKTVNVIIQTLSLLVPAVGLAVRVAMTLDYT